MSERKSENSARRALRQLVYWWRKLGVTGKFVSVFSVMLLLVLFAAITGYLSYYYMRKAEHDIRAFTQIREFVLEMDLGLEKARRLHNGFFLQYRQIGFQQAHEQYAQPSVREISRVISLSSQLQDMLFSANRASGIEIHPADVNLFLASAKRFADTSIGATELITERGAPERGVEARLKTSFSTLGALVSPYTRLWSLQNTAFGNYREYLIRRHRHLMQSSLNDLYTLRQEVDTDPNFSIMERRLILEQVRSISRLTEELLDIDLKITSRLRDFSLQEMAVAPVAAKMIRLSRDKVEQAERNIDRIFRVTGLVMVAITGLAVLVVLCLARLMHTGVTKKIIQLSEASGEISDGRLNVRVPVDSADELGSLGKIFNEMAERLEDLVLNLENKVHSRTQDLAASEKRFRYLVQDLPKIAVQGYNVNREVVYWNQASEILYGYSREEALGCKIEELIFPESMHHHVAWDVQNWDENNQPIPSAELVFRHKDGHEVNVYSSHVMQTIGGDRIMYCVDIDLGELKSAQEGHRRSEAFYRQLFDHSSSGVTVYEAVDEGRDFMIRDMNCAGESIEKFRREDLVGRLVTEAFPGIVEFGLLDVLREVWRSGEPAHHPVSLYEDERIKGWRESRVYKLSTGEVVAVYDDVTDQKRVEQEKTMIELRLQRAQKMEAIGLLAGGVAHDLNNILSAIVGYPDLIAMRLPRESDLLKPLNAMKEAGERASAVVADLLTVARGVAGTKSPEDIHKLIRQYLDSPEFEQLRNNHPAVHFSYEFNEMIPKIYCSPIHVSKCLMNLVLNGVEAIETGGEVTVATGMEIPDNSILRAGDLKPGEYVTLTITDTGKGISEHDLEHIFEPFYTKKVMGKRSGTGLGLSVVWNTMKEHEGAVFVDSGNNGTSFTLYFPVMAIVETDEASSSESVDLRGEGETVLVVDDESQQRDLVGNMLEYYGYTVVSCDSGENALDYLRDHSVDLVVLDMLMEPGMNGRQTYERILQIKPNQRAVVVSGFSESEDVKAVLDMGGGGYIKKPYSMQELAVAVKNELNRQEKGKRNQS